MQNLRGRLSYGGNPQIGRRGWDALRHSSYRVATGKYDPVEITQGSECFLEGRGVGSAHTDLRPEQHLQAQLAQV